MDDLVKRLREVESNHSGWGYAGIAADRIEELEANLALMEDRCATLYEGWRLSRHALIDAEAKLEKAVKALAELKGQNDE